MNKYRLHKAGIDANEAMRRFCGDEDFYVRMLRDFAQQDYLTAIKDGVAAGDAEATFRAVHSLKGVSGNLSMIALYDSLLPLVETTRVGSLEGAGETMVAIEGAYNAVSEALTDV